MTLQRVSATEAVASALSEGINTVEHIAYEAAMSRSAVAQTIQRMKKAGTIVRTNKISPATYRLTKEGKAAHRKTMKRLEL